MTNLFDALEFCLREIEEGGDMETALARFPEYRDELRPILETSIKARAMAAPEPSAEAVRRSRAKVMQRAAELRETKAPAHKRSIPLFQRLAISFALAVLFLLSGSGLLSASASALPGERLYPVKRGWESVRLFLIFDSEARELLEHEFKNERLHEVNELLAKGRHEVIEFAGVFMQVNGISYVSGLQVILPPASIIPENGAAVLVSGQTNAQGFVELISIELLPAGTVVPLGNPVEMEVESTSSEDKAPTAEAGSGSNNEAFVTPITEYEVNGLVNVISTTNLVINGMIVYLENTTIDGALCVGAIVEVNGYYASDGRFIALKVKSNGNCSNSSPSNNNGQDNSPVNGNNSNSDNSSNSASDADNSNSDHSNDDNSNDDNESDDDNNDDDSDNNDSNDD